MPRFRLPYRGRRWLAGLLLAAVVAPASAAATSADGIVLTKATTLTSTQAEIHQALVELAARGPLNLEETRQFLQRVRAGAATDTTVWQTLRAAKQQQGKGWNSLRGIENQLTAILRDVLVDSREAAIKRGALGSVLAFQDSGEWRRQSADTLSFDSDFTMAFFADAAADLDPTNRAGVLHRLNELLEQRLGLDASQLGIRLVSFVYAAQGDRYLSPSGATWDPHAPASHLHLVEPNSGHIGRDIVTHPELLFALRQQATLRQRLPRLFNADGRLPPHLDREEARRRSRLEADLPTEARTHAATTLLRLDIAGLLGGYGSANTTATALARTARLTALAATAGADTPGGQTLPTAYTPAENDFIHWARGLEESTLDWALAVAALGRLAEAHPDPSAWTETEVGLIDRLGIEARRRRAVVEKSLAEAADKWPAESARQLALMIVKKQASTSFSAALRDSLGLPAEARRQALGAFARELEARLHRQQTQGVPADLWQWTGSGLDTTLLLQEMAADPHFGELWDKFNRISRTGSGEINRLKSFLARSEAGQRLLKKTGSALDALATLPGNDTLVHPLAAAGQRLRQLGGGYTALLAGLAEAAERPQTARELATAIARSLAATATARLIARQDQTLSLAGDDPANTRLLAYLLAPETELPDMIAALGQEADAPGGSRVFDTRLEALYLIGRFDDEGALIDLGGHGHDRFPQLLAALLGADGDRVLAEWLGQAAMAPDNALAERAGKIGPEARQILLTSLYRTLRAGDHVLFRDDAALASHCRNIRTYGEEIRRLSTALGLAAPTEATAADFYPAGGDPGQRRPDTPAWATALDAGQLRVLAQLFVARDVWRGRAEAALLADIGATLKSTPKPSCAYDYGEWEDCDTARRQQSRALIARRPVGCAVRQAPILTQDCVPPVARLATDQATPLVGETVTVTVHVSPEFSDARIGFDWEITGSTAGAGPVATVPNGRAYAFRPRDLQPVTIRVRARSKNRGTELATSHLTLTARPPQLSVTGPHLTGPAPLAWRQGVGLVPLEGQVAEGQRVDFAVALNPVPTQELRYQWDVQPAGCTLATATTARVSLTCDKIGHYGVTVRVSNADSAELGSGSAGLDVTVTQAAIAAGQRLAAAARQQEEARAELRQGHHDAALAAIRRGRELEPSLVDDVAGELAAASKRLAREAEARRDFQTAKRLFVIAREARHEDKEASQGADDADGYQQRLNQLSVLQKEAEADIGRGDWDMAESRLDALRRLEATLPGEPSAASRSLIARLEQGHTAYKTDLAKRRQAIDTLLGRNCLDRARADILALRRGHLLATDREWTRQVLAEIDKKQWECQIGNTQLGNDCGRTCGGEESRAGGEPGTAGKEVGPGLEQEADDLLGLIKELRGLVAE